jgi:hypothetical protein
MILGVLGGGCFGYNIDKGIHREGVDFLQKPLTVATLLAKVREVLDR